jgi:Zn-dependent protease
MELLYLLPGAFLAPVIHEWVKAFTSHIQGDPTPRNHGLVTFNPFKFFEPVGFMIMLYSGGFGWGQPVPTASLHYKNRRKGTLITYITPSAVNLLIGIISVAVLSLIDNGSVGAHLWILYNFAKCNILLALFNLLPVHPLDMSKILHLFVRPDTLVKLNHYEKPMQIILILALVFGLVGAVFHPAWNFIARMAWIF